MSSQSRLLFLYALTLLCIYQLYNGTTWSQQVYRSPWKDGDLICEETGDQIGPHKVSDTL